MAIQREYIDGTATLDITHNELTRYVNGYDRFLVVGETFYYRGDEYIVNEIMYSTSSINENFEVTYMCTKLHCDPYMFYDNYGTMNKHIIFSTSNNNEEISEETRNEFMELLE